MKPGRTLEHILAGSKNIRFADAVRLVKAFGFELVRRRGSHHIFKHENVVELVNLQEVNGQAKPYQLKQVLDLVERYNLTLEDDA